MLLFFVSDGGPIAGRITICAEIWLRQAGVTSGNEERPEVSCWITSARLEQPIWNWNTQHIAKIYWLQVFKIALLCNTYMTQSKYIYISNVVKFPLINKCLETKVVQVHEDRCKGRHQWKKTLPESPKSLPPPWPQLGQLSPFFSDVIIQELKVTWGLKVQKCGEGREIY